MRKVSDCLVIKVYREQKILAFLLSTFAFKLPSVFFLAVRIIWGHDVSKILEHVETSPPKNYPAREVLRKPVDRRTCLSASTRESFPILGASEVQESVIEFIEHINVVGWFQAEIEAAFV